MPQNTQQRHGTRDSPYNMKPATDHRQCMEISLPQNTCHRTPPQNTTTEHRHRTPPAAMNPDLATERRPKNSDLSLPRNT